VTLFTRKDCWVPTARGWGLFALVLLVAMTVWAFSVNSFLCTSHPLAAEVLVVESWLPDDVMQGAVAEYKRGEYKVVLSPGSMPPPTWARRRYPTIAAFAAANLAVLGIDSNSIVSIPGEKILRDRTYASAVAVNDWLKVNLPSVRAINVYSMGAHARRTRLLYQKVFGDKVEVGIFSHRDRSYNPKWWWANLEGTREVVGEWLAYLYARFLFWPCDVAAEPLAHLEAKPFTAFVLGRQQ
jgi:hypothetical protein